MAAIQLHGLPAVGGFRHHGHVGLHVDDGADAHARHQVVFGDQYPNGIAHGRGAVISTSVPWPGRLARRISPPKRSARSRIPSNPKCPREENTSFCSNPRPLSTMRRDILRPSVASLIQIFPAAASFRALVTAS